MTGMKFGSSGNPSLTWAKGQIGARWAAADENGDTLLYKIEIRGENETVWKPLRDNLRERYYSWDSTAFPDGKYRVRVTASDLGAIPLPSDDRAWSDAARRLHEGDVAGCGTTMLAAYGLGDRTDLYDWWWERVSGSRGPRD